MLKYLYWSGDVGIEIKNTKVEIDFHGLLSKTIIDTTTPTTVFELDKKAVSAEVEFNILSLSVTDAIVNIWILPNNKQIPEDVDLIENGLVFTQNSVYVRTGIVVGKDEKIVIGSTSPGLIIRITGTIDNTP